jgi:hypothetical protein
MGHNKAMKLSSLPLGARFKHAFIEDMEFVLLDKYGRGLVAPWRGVHGNYIETVYSAAETIEEFKTMEVYEAN